MDSDEEKKLQRRKKWLKMQELEEEHEKRKQKFILDYEIRRQLQQLENDRSLRYSRRSETPKQQKRTKVNPCSTFTGPEGTIINKKELSSTKIQIYNKNIATNKTKKVINTVDGGMIMEDIIPRKKGEGGKALFDRKEIKEAWIQLEESGHLRTVIIEKNSSGKNLSPERRKEKSHKSSDRVDNKMPSTSRQYYRSRSRERDVRKDKKRKQRSISRRSKSPVQGDDRSNSSRRRHDSPPNKKRVKERYRDDDRNQSGDDYHQSRVNHDKKALVPYETAVPNPPTNFYRPTFFLVPNVPNPRIGFRRQFYVPPPRLAPPPFFMQSTIPRHFHMPYIPPRRSLQLYPKKITVLMMRGYSDRIRSYREVADLFNATYPDREPSSKSTVERTVNRFRRTGVIKDAPRSGRPKSAINDEEAFAVLLTVHDHPHTSVSRTAQENDISLTVHRILKKHHYHPYKIHLVQELSEDVKEEVHKDGLFSHLTLSLVHFS